MHCTFCNTKLLPEAKFCHVCGQSTASSIVCSSCKQVNPYNAIFCIKCGFELKKTAQNDFVSSRVLFEEFLEKEVQAKNGYPNPSRIKERYASPKYKQVFDIRFGQLDSDIQNGVHVNTITYSLLGLLEFFLIMYCKDLFPHSISERVLKYDRKLVDFDLQQMAEDYLLLDNLDEDIYYSLLDVDFDLLENASKSYFMPGLDEYLIFMLDLSFVGNLKHGIAVTDKALYWKIPLQSSKKIPYLEIESLELDNERLLVNGHYLDVNAAFNFRFRRFLQRIMLLNLDLIKKRDA
jgi:ribosomal protein L40E